MKLRTKLMMAFAALAAAVLMVSGLALHSLSRSNERFKDYLGGVAEREGMAVDVRNAANARAIAARNLVLVTEAADRVSEKAAVMAAHELVKKSIARLNKELTEGNDVTRRDRELAAEIEKIEAAYTQVAEAIVGMVSDGKREEAVAKMNKDCRPLLAALLQATTNFIENDKAQAAAAVAAADASYASDRLLMILCSVAAVGAAVALGWVLSNAVTRPLNRAVKLAEAVANGDLRSDIVVDRHDETGLLLAALQKMNTNLVNMIGQVRDSADGLAAASTQIANGNQDLSGRTEQQASALQQTAASMHEMTHTVQRNAESSRQAGTLAATAAEVASRGGKVVERVVETMGQISDSSKRIADIIGVID
ncbi:MAG: MCP four helix bundle domain-containing protein, partial [Rhizobacter sp.]